MEEQSKHLLSKSTFVRGCQCVKSLYLNKYQKDLRGEIDEQTQMIFDIGHNVGELAQKLFPNGEFGTLQGEIPSLVSVNRTQELIKNGASVIYEATFMFDEVMVAMDILVKHETSWKAYEVKSSTKVSETYLIDTAVQYYVITNSGVELSDISIVHIDNQYVKQGEIDVFKLFKIESVYSKAKENQEFVKVNISKFKDILRLESVPEIEIGTHCFSPYTCDFEGHCWQNVPENSIFSYKGMKGDKKWDLFKSNIHLVENIPDDYYLNNTESLVVNSVKNNETHINKPALKTFVSKLQYPLYFLDFETLYMVTIPIYDNTRPYQQVPFQYSLHIKQNPNSELEHKHFLAEANQNIDPRFEFIERLINDIGTSGNILVYNASFEINKLQDIKTLLPKLSNKIDAIISRVVDLMVPFRSRHFYTPEMKGSYSIKQVLPALVPNLSYKGMNIADGGTASASFMSLFNETNTEVINKVREDLLKYCELDTFAMVKIVEKLNEL